jgi:hypothetical protein
MRQPPTTFFGILAIVLGTFGSVLAAAVLIYNLHGYSAGDALVLIQSSTSFAAKSGVALTGVLLLMRSRLALIALVCVCLISICDSLITFGWLLPPVSPALSPAGHAGRILGRAMGLALPAVLYIMLFVYLMLPKTRQEFGDRGSANGVG